MLEQKITAVLRIAGRPLMPEAINTAVFPDGASDVDLPCLNDNGVAHKRLSDYATKP